MDENIFDKIHDIDLKKTMETSYIDYAMSVIAARALPDVRDGLKPVQRRILYSMIELNNGPDKPHRKCARIVGDTMGKYHPHGDSSIYEALVKLAQDFNTRYPLVDGHGNFGSVDGDGAAAMRYTEARLSKISMEMLSDINKDTVDFIPNFDDTEKEPAVLPSRYPNLLVNGTTGIAVGMATNIPPHNLRETIDAVVKLIDNQVEEDRETEIEELLQIVKGPDFPTGAEIVGRSGIDEAYRTGRGKVRVRAVADIEAMANGKSRIVVTEIPYMVNKARLIEKIADLVKEKKIDGITDLRDESDRFGMRIVIELRRDANANVVLNKLYKHTSMMETFGVIMLALVNNEPKVLNLKDMLVHYLNHQKEVVTRRTRYELNKAEERAHILQGLLVALDHIDEVISIIRGSRTTAEAKQNLIARFELTEAQAQAIVDMRLKALTGLEREKLEAEYEQLMAQIAEYKAILADEKKLLGIIKDEITIIRDKFGDDRRTTISMDEADLCNEDLIPDESVVITMTNLGYIKRMNSNTFQAQNRGGKGIKGMQTIEDDMIKDMIMSRTHDYLLFFTNMGRVYRLKSYEIPEASRTARGTAIINILQLQAEEKISAIVPYSADEESGYIMMATQNGMVKKTALSEYANIRKNGLIAINMRENDALMEVKYCSDGDSIFLATQKGMCIQFDESDVRPTGRSSMGVKGIEVGKDDLVIAMLNTKEGEDILFITERGMGKRTSVTEFKSQNRGGKGIKCYKLTDKTGLLKSVKSVDEDKELMVITTEGIIIRVAVEGISSLGRVTSGVKVMNIDEEKTGLVASIAITDKEEDVEELLDEDGNPLTDGVEALDADGLDADGEADAGPLVYAGDEKEQISTLLERAKADQEEE